MNSLNYAIAAVVLIILVVVLVRLLDGGAL